MAYLVDFAKVSTIGLASSPVAEALAGLRANEARYFFTKYNHRFTVHPVEETSASVDYVRQILQKERAIAIASPPLETSRFEVENLRMTYVFYQSGLVVNVMYSIDGNDKRAVGFKLSQGMEVPAELQPKFKFARQKSKLAGEIRGSFFVIKGTY